MLDRRILRSDMLRCVLCHDAPCSVACSRLDPAALLRSLWFDNEKNFGSVKEAVGLALDSVSVTTDVLERDTVIFPKFLREKCVGCGRCVISCADGGHQAITLNEQRKPLLNGRKCVGCHLCVLVCPQKAIRSGSKRITKARASYSERRTYRLD